MNLPNKLTMARIIAVPIFVILYMKQLYLAAFIVFILASFTDMLDGKIARKYNLITNFGKIMDPLADKILVYSAFCLMIGDGTVPAWMLIIILLREFAVSGMRTVAAANGIVIAAGMSGKIKTVLQMILAAWAFLSLFLPLPAFILPILIAAAAVMTAWSGILYFIRLKDSLFDKDL